MKDNNFNAKPHASRAKLLNVKNVKNINIGLQYIGYSKQKFGNNIKYFS